MNPHFTQADKSLQARCIGCAIPLPATPLAGSCLIADETGRTAYVCPGCSERAANSDIFRHQVESCVRTGVGLVEVRAVFARAGMEIPTTMQSFIAGVLRGVAPRPAAGEPENDEGRTVCTGQADAQHPPICAACGVPVQHSPNFASGDLPVCTACSPHVNGDPRMLATLWACHDKGLTLAQAAHAAGFRPGMRR